ncbi:MAG: protease-4, partial [Arcobacteraceae bacterium]
PTREWSKDERAELEKVIKATYNMFIADVSNARNLKKENHKEYADAHIFTAAQAKKAGLIDEVATINSAKMTLVALAKVNKAVWSKEDKMDKFMQNLLKNSITNIASDLNGLMAK